MKEDTKWKIIIFVKKLLRVKAYSPPYNIEERKIQKIQSTHIIPIQEREHFLKMEEEMISHYEKELSISITQTMMNIGAIKFEIEDEEMPGGLKIRVTTYIPEKL
jgi:hypothetical protein